MLSLFLLLTCAAQGTKPAVPSPQADRILLNAQIYTVDPQRPWARAMAIGEGKILSIGSERSARAFLGPHTEVVDLHGRMVMPGIGDSHIHLLEAHHPAAGTVMLESGHPLESYVPQIRAAAPHQLGTRWVLGWGFSIFDVLIDEIFLARPPVAILDDAVPHRPAAIMEETSHAVWANALALQAAGIGPNTPDPPGGVIMRSFWTGKPNGILIDTAGEQVMDLALARSPALDRLNRVALRIGYAHAARNGITALADARCYWKRGYVEAYRWAQRNGVMSARTVLGLWAYPDLDDDLQIPRLASMYENRPGSRLRITQIKLYSDGITTMSTAALLAPYHHLRLSGPRGLNYFPRPRLSRYLDALEGVGFDFHIHAIGDRAVHEALDAVELAQHRHPALPPRRHRITHLELVDPADIPRFRRLGVIADFQMSSDFVLPEHEFDLAPFLGRHRIAERSLPLRDLWASGAHVVLSSDYDVGALSPFVGMRNALCRGAQSLPDVAAAIRAYTLEPAYLMRLETVTGSLVAGKSADYIVLDRNPFQIPKQRIGETRVLQTVLEGQEVWRAPGY